MWLLEPQLSGSRLCQNACITFGSLGICSELRKECFGSNLKHQHRCSSPLTTAMHKKWLEWKWAGEPCTTRYNLLTPAAWSSWLFFKDIFYRSWGDSMFQSGGGINWLAGGSTCISGTWWYRDWYFGAVSVSYWGPHVPGILIWGVLQESADYIRRQYKCINLA